MKFDVIIIGGGTAGLSAALWCDDLKLNALLLERKTELGGQLLRVFNPIKNHLGIVAKNGRGLRDVFIKQLENHQFTVRLQSESASVDLENKSVTLTSDEIFSANAIIIATGVSRRKLNVEGEEKFKDKGIIESGKRDANLMKDKNVCIVGGGDAALENAMILSESASCVTLIHRQKDFRARAEFMRQVKNNKKVEILTDTVVRKIIGNQRIEAVELEHLKTGKVEKKNTDAVLIRIGVKPNTEFLRGQIDLDEQGYIKTNQSCETSIAGVFAVGDVANRIAPTVSGAVGTGATAAKAIANFKLGITN